MNKFHDIFGPGSNLETRIVRDYSAISERVRACRDLGLKVVLTSGTYDLPHEGHQRYLEIAKNHGDVLIVGVDNDEKVKARKGSHRPFDSEMQRMEMLCHSRHPDLVFLKKLEDLKWQLIKAILPDVLIATEGTYRPEEIEALQEFCKEVVVLPPQAATSTTSKFRIILKNSLGGLRQKFQEVIDLLDELSGGVQ